MTSERLRCAACGCELNVTKSEYSAPILCSNACVEMLKESEKARVGATLAEQGITKKALDGNEYGCHTE